MFKSHWYWSLCSLGWKEVPQNLGKDFQRKENRHPCAWMDSSGWMMKNSSFLVSPFFKKVNLREANVKCKNICPHIYVGEMANSDKLAQVTSPRLTTETSDMEHQCLPDTHKTLCVSTTVASTFINFLDHDINLSPFYIHFMWKFGKRLWMCNLVFFSIASRPMIR